MNALQVLDASIHTLDTREDVTNLAKCFDLQGLQYLEIQAVQNFQLAMAHWPLLMETLQPSLVGYETIINPLPVYLSQG